MILFEADHPTAREIIDDLMLDLYKREQKPSAFIERIRNIMGESNFRRIASNPSLRETVESQNLNDQLSLVGAYAMRGLIEIDTDQILKLIELGLSSNQITTKCCVALAEFINRSPELSQRIKPELISDIILTYIMRHLSLQTHAGLNDFLEAYPTLLRFEKYFREFLISYSDIYPREFFEHNPLFQFFLLLAKLSGWDDVLTHIGKKYDIEAGLDRLFCEIVDSAAAGNFEQSLMLQALDEINHDSSEMVNRLAKITAMRWKKEEGFYFANYWVGDSGFLMKFCQKFMETLLDDNPTTLKEHLSFFVRNLYFLLQTEKVKLDEKTIQRLIDLVLQTNHYENKTGDLLLLGIYAQKSGYHCSNADKILSDAINRFSKTPIGSQSFMENIFQDSTFGEECRLSCAYLISCIESAPEKMLMHFSQIVDFDGIQKNAHQLFEKKDWLRTYTNSTFLSEMILSLSTLSTAENRINLVCDILYDEALRSFPHLYKQFLNNFPARVRAEVLPHFLKRLGRNISSDIFLITIESLAQTVISGLPVIYDQALFNELIDIAASGNMPMELRYEIISLLNILGKEYREHLNDAIDNFRAQNSGPLSPGNLSAHVTIQTYDNIMEKSRMKIPPLFNMIFQKLMDKATLLARNKDQISLSSFSFSIMKELLNLHGGLISYIHKAMPDYPSRTGVMEWLRRRHKNKNGLLRQSYKKFFEESGIELNNSIHLTLKTAFELEALLCEFMHCLEQSRKEEWRMGRRFSSAAQLADGKNEYIWGDSIISFLRDFKYKLIRLRSDILQEAEDQSPEFHTMPMTIEDSCRLLKSMINSRASH